MHTLNLTAENIDKFAALFPKLRHRGAGMKRGS